MSDRHYGGIPLGDELQLRLIELANAISEGGPLAAPRSTGGTEVPPSVIGTGGTEDPPSVIGTGGTESPPSTLANAATDHLLLRIAALTTQLRRRSAPLDDVDAVAARLLLSDLSVLTSTWQSLSVSTRETLDAAQAELDRAKGGGRRVEDDSEDAR
jgi:hypothetical protein